MRIGIVNDMALAREALRRVVQASPGHQVAWLAADGAEAVTRTCCDPPDLILMDLVMPGMDGVEATRRIMAEQPCPILVVTSNVNGHFSKVYDAMGHGALDAVDTPSLGPKGEMLGSEPLLAKIATIAKLTGKGCGQGASTTKPAPQRATGAEKRPLVVVGASTGGPNALAEVLSTFPKSWEAPVVLIQHIDASLAPGLANWLTQQSGRKVEIIEPGVRPVAGQVLLAASNDHLVFQGGMRLSYVSEPLEFCYRPSVDVFFASVAAHWPGTGVAALLTGMGRDGATGMLTLRRAGWYTIAQDAETSVVWGMPRAAVEVGAATEVLPLPRIGSMIVSRVQQIEREDGAQR